MTFFINYQFLTIKHLLGEGGFGEAFLMENDETKELKVWKHIKKYVDEKEIEIHKQLNHQNIIKYINHHNVNEFSYIEM